MTGCVLYGALPAAQGWVCEVGVFVYDFHTLIAQLPADISFDLRHRRYVPYLNIVEGSA